MHSAVAGIAEAGRMHERAAIDVQRSSLTTASEVPARPPQEGSAGQAATLEFSSASQDLASAMTTMMKAGAYNKANVAVLKTADEMTEELTRIIR